MEDNPYEPPKVDEPSATGADVALTDAEIRAFVGKNGAYYLRKWTPAIETNGRVRRFNAAAFFLSGLWIPYRKMYRVLLILFGIAAGESLLEGVALYAGLIDERSLEGLSRLVGLGFSIVCGAYGNAWYLTHTRREIARIRALGLDDDAYYAALARRGGTSLLAAVVLFGLFLTALYMVLSAIEYCLFEA